MISQLRYIGFIDPRFFRSLPITTRVDSDSALRVGTSELHFVSDSLPVGTEVKIWISSGNFVCQSIAEIEAEEVQREEMFAERQRLAAEKEASRQQEAIKLNQSLNIPVSWYPDVKPVLSGLTESGMGNGCKSNTVFHVVLNEDLHSGRLHRVAGQPLCSSSMGKFGDLVGWHKEEQSVHKVTCKKCLEIAGKFI